MGAAFLGHSAPNDLRPYTGPGLFQRVLILSNPYKLILKLHNRIKSDFISITVK